jgi:hypothetical protein
MFENRREPERRWALGKSQKHLWTFTEAFGVPVSEREIPHEFPSKSRRFVE